MFKFSIKEEETLEDDLKKMLPKIQKAIGVGLKVVQSDMQDCLQDWVQYEVYDGYNPTEYQRRGYNGGMIADNSMMGIIRGNSLTFSYWFSGYNEAYPYSPRYYTADEIIKTIQSGNNYLWNVQGKDIPERPFWDDFLNEQINKGRAEITLARAMRNYDNELNVQADGNISDDGKDSRNLHW